MLEQKELIQSRQTEADKIEADIVKKKEIQRQLQELTDKGVSVDLMKRLRALEIKSGEDLSERIQTLALYLQLVEENTNLKKTVDSLGGKEAKAKQRLETLEAKIVSKRNELDNEKENTKAYKKAVGVTESILKEGYSTKDLQALRRGLKAVAVKDNPDLSIARYIDGLQRIRSLTSLNDDIDTATKTHKTLLKNIKTAEGILSVYQNTVLQTLNEAKDRAIKEFNAVDEKIIRDFNSAGQVAIEHIKKAMAAPINQLSDINTTIMSNLNAANNNVNTLTANIKTDISRVTGELNATIQRYQQDMEEWNTLQDKIREATEMAKYGYVLLGVFDDASLMKLPVRLISRLINKINTYTSLLYFDAMTKPSHGIVTIESDLNPEHDYKLRALTWWLKEAFENKTLESMRNAR